MVDKIFVVGDVELGGGTLTDNFISDKTLSKWINKLALAPPSQKIELVLNGDSFDFLLCPVIHKEQEYYLRYITAAISVRKIKTIMAAHPMVMDALANFIKNKYHRLIFTIGNHDPDIVFKEVQNNIRERLGNHDRVLFPGMRYKTQGVHIEHGQQLDTSFVVDEGSLTTIYKGREILVLPMGAYGIMFDFMPLKKKFPFAERTHPRPFTLDKQATLVGMITIFRFLFKYSFYYPARYWSDPTYRFPVNLWRELFDKIRKYKFRITRYINVDDVTTKFSNRVRQAQSADKIYILGHTHKEANKKRDGKVFLNPGPWSDGYFFDLETKAITSMPKRFIEINFERGRPSAVIKTVPTKKRHYAKEEWAHNDLEMMRKIANSE